MGARDCDFLGQFNVQLVVELVNLILQLFLYLCDRIGHSPSPKKNSRGRIP